MTPPPPRPDLGAPRPRAVGADHDDRQLRELADRLATEHLGHVPLGRVLALVHQADRLLALTDEQGEQRLDEIASVVGRLLLRDLAARSRAVPTPRPPTG